MKKLTIFALLVSLVVVGSVVAAGTDAPPRARSKDLVDSAATGFVDVSIQSNSYTSGIVRWRIDATDGTDYQSRTGATYFVAVNKAGTVTCSVGDIGTTVVAVSAGTLTNTMTCTAGTAKFTLNANANPSVTATSLKIKYYVDLSGSSVSAGL